MTKAAEILQHAIWHVQFGGAPTTTREPDAGDMAAVELLRAKLQEVAQ